MESAEGQPLIMSRDHGGLWTVTEKAVSIFKVCGKEFISATSYKTSHHIDRENIVYALMGNCYVLSNFDDISKSAYRWVDKEISKNLLRALLDLYVRVCAHSHAKKIERAA